MNYFVMDLETKSNQRALKICEKNITPPANWKDPEKIENYIKQKRESLEKDVCTDPDFADIFCVGIKKMGGEANVLSLEETVDFFEYQSLEDDDMVLVTFNGEKFDLPLLIKAGIREGMGLPYKELYHSLNYKIPQEMKSRTRNKIFHIDLARLLSPFEPNFKSLDTYLQVYLGIEKKEIDFSTATDKEIKEHCIEDLENTEKLFTLFQDVL